MRKLMIVLLAGAICLLGVTSALAVKYNEAPMLKTKVAAGLLPPVEERLPEKPVVVKPLEEIGQYGGQIVTFRTDAANWNEGYMVLGAEGMLRIETDLSISPNIAKEAKFSEDAKTLTLYLHKGIKWSDGIPFTTDDVLFWYEDVLLNDDLTPVKPKMWSPGGKLMTMEKVDDYTVRLHFAAPHPLAKARLAHFWGTMNLFYIPKHYMKQFHPRYVPIEKLNKLAKEKGYDLWYKLFNYERRKESFPANPDLPTLTPWRLVEEKPESLLFERNPYYWKVDPAGNQLPYIDKIRLALVSNTEIVNGKVISGDADYAAYELRRLDDYPLFMENAEKGGYRVLLYKSVWGAEAGFGPNQVYNKDPVLRDIFRDVRFRRALSLAIDREDINEALFFGKAVPRQMTVVPESSFYEKKFATSYAEYNLKEANRLLDEMGLKWDKNHEYRLRPDGKVLSWIIEYFRPGKTRIIEMVTGYWKEIGLKVSLKLTSGDLLSTRLEANQVAMNMGDCDDTTDMMFLLDPYWAVPTSTWAEWTWGRLWGIWYRSGGKDGEEPPAEIKRLFNLWEKMKVAIDEKERIRLGKEILASQAENLWTIGTVGLAPSLVTVKKNMRNIPETALKGWDLFHGYAYHSEQWFFKQR
ncbi:MAG: ABC transporter substrate-binding protein [Firmicutes bacterium]|nr:ABC transporter substrate-binding protein [Bacillota bacterium]